MKIHRGKKRVTTEWILDGKRWQSKSEDESVKEVVRGFMELVDATADRKTEPQNIKEQTDVDNAKDIYDI